MSACVLVRSVAGKLAGLFAFSPCEKVTIALERCCDIHTAGMRAPIDAAFVGKDGRVVMSVRGLSPWRRLRCPGAVAVLERYAAPDAPWIEKGDFAPGWFPELAGIVDVGCEARGGPLGACDADLDAKGE